MLFQHCSTATAVQKMYFTQTWYNIFLDFPHIFECRSPAGTIVESEKHEMLQISGVNIYYFCFYCFATVYNRQIATDHRPLTILPECCFEHVELYYVAIQDIVRALFTTARENCYWAPPSECIAGLLFCAWRAILLYFATLCVLPQSL